MQKIVSWRTDFAPFLENKIRRRMLQSCTKNNFLKEILIKLFQSSGDESWLHAKEAYFLIEELRKAKKVREACLYFCLYEKNLVDFFSRNKDRSFQSLSSLYLSMAHLNAEMGQVKRASEYALKVSPEDSCYQQSLEFLLKTGSSRTILIRKGCLDFDKKDLSWEEKIKQLSGLLSKASKNKMKISLDTVILNAVCADILSFFPKLPRAWEAVSLVLCEYKNLWEKLPNLFHIYHTKQLELHEPSYDMAIWSPVLEAKLDKGLRSFYAIGLIHKFICSWDESENSFWQARDIFLKLDNKKNNDTKSWSQICSWAVDSLQQCHYIPKSKRDHNELVFLASMQGRETKSADIANYLRAKIRPPLDLLQDWYLASKEQGDCEVEAKIINLIAGQSSYCNSALHRLLLLYKKTNKDDLCWRVMTILNARGDLEESYQKAWSVSGEKRFSYSYTQIGSYELEFCLDGIDAVAKSFIKSLFYVGLKVNQLCSYYDSDLRSLKLKAWKEDLLASKIHAHLDTFSFFKKQKISSIYGRGTQEDILEASIFFFQQKLYKPMDKSTHESSSLHGGWSLDVGS